MQEMSISLRMLKVGFCSNFLILIHGVRVLSLAIYSVVILAVRYLRHARLYQRIFSSILVHQAFQKKERKNLEGLKDV